MTDQTPTPPSPPSEALAEAVMNTLLATDKDLPAIQLSDFKEITRAHSDNEVIDADVAIVNDMLKLAHSAWGGVRTLKGFESMINNTLKLIEARRKALGKPYGYISQSKGSGLVEVPE